jgi:methionyl-tRNA synthetase
LPDRYIEGTCPICGYDGARGDQCDNCGNQLDPIDLKNPRSKINGETPKFVETEHFFLDLPAFTDALAGWLGTRTDWRPNVLKFSQNLINELQPRAISRDLDWGVPIPIEGWENRDDKRSYYFMGKDNIVFHSLIWPSILLGYDGSGDKGGERGSLGKLELPTELVSSEFLTMEGRKFSSSRQVVIYVRDFLERYDADALRYFVAVAGPENQDSDFTWSDFVRRNNDELVAGWGNLVNRSVSMAAKNFGRIPEAGELTDADRALTANTHAAFGIVGDLLERSRQKAAISEAMRAVAEANKYISDQAPWKLKEDPVRQGTVLHVALQAVRDLNTIMTPFVPHAAQRIHETLGGVGTWSAMPEMQEVTEGDGAEYPVLMGDYRAAYDAGVSWGPHSITAGTPLEPPVPVFAKLDPGVADEEVARLEAVVAD